METSIFSPGARAGLEHAVCTPKPAQPPTCSPTHWGFHLPSQQCEPWVQAPHTLFHSLLLLIPTPKHSWFHTISTARAHILTVSYSQTVSLPPVIGP